MDRLSKDGPPVERWASADQRSEEGQPAAWTRIAAARKAEAAPFSRRTCESGPTPKTAMDSAAGQTQSKIESKQRPGFVDRRYHDDGLPMNTERCRRSRQLDCYLLKRLTFESDLSL
jgi:hypothetical protein